MPDREKVIKGLECCVNPVPEFDCSKECPYFGKTAGACYTQLSKDALELLQGQDQARCENCQFRDYGKNEVDAWDMCRLHRHNTSADEYCSWFVEKDGEA